MPRLVLLDALPAVAAYERAQGCAAEDVLIAMNPRVRAALLRRGRTARATTPYFTNGSHAAALQRSEQAVRWFEQRLAFGDLGVGVERAYRDTCIFWMRLAVHYCVWVIEIALNAMDIHQPSALVAARPSKRSVRSLYVEPAEGHFGALIERVAAQHHRTFAPLASGRGHATLRGVQRAGTAASAWLRFAVRYARICSGMPHRWPARRDDAAGPIVLTTRHYHMDALAERLQRHQAAARLLLLPGPVLPPGAVPTRLMRWLAGAAGEQIIAHKRLCVQLASDVREAGECFMHRGISFADILAEKLLDNITDHLIGLQLWTVLVDRWLDRVRPTAVVSNGNRDDDVVVAELCRRQRVPDVLISHGSHVPPANTSERIEWGEHGRVLARAPFSHVALQSPLAEGHAAAFPSDSRLIKTGPLIWGTPVDHARSQALFAAFFPQRSRERLRIIVHAGTPKASNSLRLHVYETPDEYLQSVCDLASAVQRLPGTALIVKFRPSPEIGVEDVRRLVPLSERVRLSVEEPFRDVLGMADLLVSFSSTTIEEALQNHIPVLLYGGGGRYQHVPAQEIVSGEPVPVAAAYAVRDAQDLPHALREILARGDHRGTDGQIFAPYVYAPAERASLLEVLQR